MPSNLVYLNFAIGDRTAHAIENEAFERARAWIDRNGAAYGYTSLEALDEDGRETIKALWEDDPSLRAQGPIRLEQPPPLPGGRLVIRLDVQDCPKTCENFRQLCIGGKIGKASMKPLHYKNTHLFRIVPGILAQGGDVTRDDGTGGDSIYNGKFNDEKAGLAKRFSRRGQLGMANSGKNSNTSQFFLTLTDDPTVLARFSGKHVLFGEIVEDEGVLHALVEAPVKDEKPLVDIVILDCGEVI